MSAEYRIHIPPPRQYIRYKPTEVSYDSPPSMLD
jgi:hypothetical protein